MWSWTRIKTSSSKECIDWLTLKRLKVSHGKVLLISIVFSTYFACTSNNCYDIDYDMHNPSNTSLWSKSCILKQISNWCKIHAQNLYLSHHAIKKCGKFEKTAWMQPPPHLNQALFSMTSNTMQQRGVRVKIQHDNNIIQPHTMKFK